ncbi:hypothetical protein SCOR_35775 [Sulfidibacter corallicola]|uniref:Uncharacterized protein n=1 Tax=Sulfidibacter corallicola TaxID=2818388 RepID=A0A8A4TRF9_SULCO|nr:hypothetical protein [Sulfidibacter corallicola]QTD49115.1 hypothetical protein J3U87_26315 [Sulfidibacter corallicola]
MSSNHVRHSSSHSSPILQSHTPSVHPHKTPSPLKLSSTPSNSSSPKLEAKGHVSHSVPIDQIALESKAKGDEAKRLQVVQLRINTIDDSGALPNSKASITAKAEAAFHAFEVLHHGKWDDPRPNTKKVYTLPEFFWNDFGHNLSPELEAHAIAEIQRLASQEQFEGCVFVCGTMTVAHAPEDLAKLVDSDLRQIEEAFGFDANALDPIKERAESSENENFKREPSRERKIMSAVGHEYNRALTALNPDAAQLAPDELKDAEIDEGEVLEAAIKEIQFLDKNRKALMFLTSLGQGRQPSEAQLNRLRDLVQQNDAAALAEAQDILASLVVPYKSAVGVKRDFKNLSSVKTILRLYTRVEKELKSQMQDPPGRLPFQTVADAVEQKLPAFKNKFLPFYMTASDRTEHKSGVNRTKIKEESRGGRTVKFRSDPNRQYTAVPMRHTMFKTTENKAIVIEGGIDGKMGSVSKVVPSEIDNPHYTKAATSGKGYSKNIQDIRHESFSAFPSGNNPQTSRQQSIANARDVGIDASSFEFESPKTGMRLAVAICRDYSEGFYDALSSEHRNVDHLQVVSAGVPSSKLPNHMDGVHTSMAVNDGLNSESKVKDFTKRQDAPSLIVDFDPHTRELTPRPMYGKQFPPTFPIDVNRGGFSVDISAPIHLDRAPDSDDESFTSETESHMKDMIAELTRSEADQISRLGDQIQTATELKNHLELSEENLPEVVEAINQNPDLTAFNGEKPVQTAEEARSLLVSYIKARTSEQMELNTAQIKRLAHLDLLRMPSHRT